MKALLKYAFSLVRNEEFFSRNMFFPKDLKLLPFTMTDSQMIFLMPFDMFIFSYHGKVICLLMMSKNV